MVNKIHIIGGAGSGKTTLAKRLSERLGCPSYDLDLVGWKEHQKVPLPERLKAIDAILSQPSWITEGIFLWWTESLFENADLILWLDFPFRVAAWRILKRHFLASWRGDNPHSGILNLINFLDGVGRGYYQRPPVGPESIDDDLAITRAATASVLAGYRRKLIRCKDQGEIDRFLSTACF
jgi:adenylate kinase family enzyme